MQSFVIASDTSVSELLPETRVCLFRVNPLTRSQCQIDNISAEIHSQISYQIENLSDWVEVHAPVSLIARLQVAGLVDVRVEG